MKRFLFCLTFLLLISEGEGLAQLPFEEFREAVSKYDLTATEFVIQGCVDSYYKHYYYMPECYDDLLKFESNDYREILVTICDSLFYKNRKAITFPQNQDSAAMLYLGQVFFALYRQHSCKDMITSPVAKSIGMVNSGGQCFYDDSIVHVIKKQILPAVYSKAKKTKCKQYYLSMEGNRVPCSIPYLYDVQNKKLTYMEDCKRCNIQTCDEFDRILEAELKKYDFEGVKLITFPVHLYKMK